MSNKDLEAGVFQIWRDTLCAEEVPNNVSLFDLGVDSIAVLEISSQIEKKYGIRLAWDVFNVTSSIDDCIKVINEQV